MKLTLANKNQVREICNLVNLAYRGAEGWTRETELIAGQRATEAEISTAIESPDSHLLIYTENQEILACICVKKEADHVQIGLFAVHPSRQGKGLGKKILNLTEEYASNHLGALKYVMLVVSQRDELVSYYERRGYIRTGKFEAFPVHLNVGVPKNNDLTIERMEKSA